MENLKTEFIYISLKHTHRKDKWFTMWRTNSAGYSFFKDSAGVYQNEYEPVDSVCSVPVSIAEKHMIEVEYEGKKRVVYPNTPKTRKELKIALFQLKEHYPYVF